MAQGHRSRSSRRVWLLACSTLAAAALYLYRRRRSENELRELRMPDECEVSECGVDGQPLSRYTG